MPEDKSIGFEDRIYKRLSQTKLDIPLVLDGPPRPEDGAEGDLTIRKIGDGVRFYAKIKNEWLGVSLSNRFLKIDADGNITVESTMNFGSGSALVIPNTIPGATPDGTMYLDPTDNTVYFYVNGTGNQIYDSSNSDVVSNAESRSLGDLLYDDGSGWVRGTLEGLTSSSGALGIVNGGTGATTASTARDNLDLGTGDNVTFNKVTSSGDIIITAGQDTDAILLLQSDNSDDAGDDWEILAKQADKKLTIGNDIASAGTYVPHITITPHATISSSIVDIHGSIRIESKLISGELRVGSHTNYIWQDGWHGYREHIFFTPADFSSNAISGGAYANAPNTATNVSDTLDDIRFTSGAPLRPRCNSHPFVTGDRVKFDSVGGTTELNGNTYVVTVSDVNNISLDGTDSDDFSAFTSGGNAVAIRRLANIAHNLAVNDFVQLPSGGGGGDEEFIVVAVSTDEFTVDSDLTNAVSSAQAEYKLSLVYHTAVNGTSALPSYGIMSGTGSTGSVLTGDANADMIAMTVIPKGFMATGAQCWATAGGGGTQPTFKVGYKLIGNDSSKTDSYSSAQTTSLADANISEISFDTAGDDASNNIECVESQGSPPVHHPRIIIMQFIKENADDELWGGVIFISPMV